MSTCHLAQEPLPHVTMLGIGLPSVSCFHDLHDFQWQSTCEKLQIKNRLKQPACDLCTTEEQLALGHYVSAQYRSAMIYSREKLEEGLRSNGTRVSRLFQLALTGSWNGGQALRARVTHCSLDQKSTYRRLEADAWKPTTIRRSLI